MALRQGVVAIGLLLARAALVLWYHNLSLFLAFAISTFCTMNLQFSCDPQVRSVSVSPDHFCRANSLLPCVPSRVERHRIRSHYLGSLMLSLLAIPEPSICCEFERFWGLCRHYADNFFCLRAIRQLIGLSFVFGSFAAHSEICPVDLRT